MGKNNGHKISSALALPRPETISLTQVRETILPAAARLRNEIERRNDIPAARELCRQLEAFRKYLQDREGRDLLAWECRETEILIGELDGPVAETERGLDGRFTMSPAGDTVGLSRKERYKFRLLATHKDYVRQLHEEKGIVSRNVFIEKIQRRQIVDRLPSIQEGFVGTEPLWAITDAQDIIECDALITDPPYGILDETWEPDQLEQFTYEWAERWNESGADFCLIFWSQEHMWAGRKWFDESLSNYTFQHLLVWHYPNNKKPQSLASFKQTWEPIFFYRRKNSNKKILVDDVSGDWGKDQISFDCHVAAVPQSNFNNVNFKEHPAQKPLSVMRWLVGAATRPGDLVCDPFAGSGTTGIAATQLKRKFYGIEISAEYRQMAETRIKLYGT